jgi:hypothetical protein
MWKNSGYFYIKPSGSSKTYFFMVDIAERNNWVEAVREAAAAAEQAKPSRNNNDNNVRPPVVPTVMHRRTFAPRTEELATLDSELSSVSFNDEPATTQLASYVPYSDSLSGMAGASGAMSAPLLSRQTIADMHKLQTIQNWSPKEVQSFLFSKGFGRYTAAFADLSGEQLSRLQIADIVIRGVSYPDAKQIYDTMHTEAPEHSMVIDIAANKSIRSTEP